MTATVLAARHHWVTGHLGNVYAALQRATVSGKRVDPRYLSLVDPAHPLMARMEQQAFGTFCHSAIVGSMAAPAAARVGGNPDLARVIGYYHDIGKLQRAALYLENQPEGRASTRPVNSRRQVRLILGHPRESARMLWENGFPSEVCRAVAEHHGNLRTKMKIEPAVAARIPLEQLHYPGPLPSILESAIVMLADSAQAMTESILHFRGTKRDISGEYLLGMVTTISNEYSNAGQFSHCQMTSQKLETIEQSIAWWLYRYYNDLKLFGSPSLQEAAQFPPFKPGR